MQMGVIPLTSKPYFPGAHAYMLKPAGAKLMVEQAAYYAGATDVFLQLSVFPWLQEYYPWPVIAKDSFTTIQNETGCQAKHSYVKNKAKYEFLKV
jgi:GR25 family glycosyltransferase involved in LPS biosynthesis